MLRGLCLLALAASLAACGSDQVGSRNCEAITASTSDSATRVACEQCQGVLCASLDAKCGLFPCEFGLTVVEGCERDDDCARFSKGDAASAICGQYSAPDNVCSFHNDDE